MCNKVINLYTFAIKFVPKCYRTQEMYAEVINTCPFVFDYVSDCAELKEYVIKLLPKFLLCENIAQ